MFHIHADTVACLLARSGCNRKTHYNFHEFVTRKSIEECGHSKSCQHRCQGYQNAGYCQLCFSIHQHRHQQTMGNGGIYLYQWNPVTYLSNGVTGHTELCILEMLLLSIVMWLISTRLQVQAGDSISLLMPHRHVVDSLHIVCAWL